MCPLLSSWTVPIAKDLEIILSHSRFGGEAEVQGRGFVESGALTPFLSPLSTCFGEMLWPGAQLSLLSPPP